jgi:HEAT repeat protein
MGLWYACFVAAGLNAAPPDTNAIAPLILALRDHDVEVRHYAGSALAAIGSPAVPSLIVALQDPDRYQRAGAAYALARLAGTAAPAKPFLMRALSDEDVAVRRHAAYAVSRLLAAERDEQPTAPPTAPPPVMPESR